MNNLIDLIKKHMGREGGVFNADFMEEQRGLTPEQEAVADQLLEGSTLELTPMEESSPKPKVEYESKISGFENIQPNEKHATENPEGIK